MYNYLLYLTVFIWVVVVILYAVKQKDYNSYKGKLNDYNYYIEWRNTLFQFVVVLAIFYLTVRRKVVGKNQ